MAEIIRAPGIASQFFHVSNELARNPELTPRAARVYLLIASHRDGWKITTETVAKTVGMSDSTVKAAINDLKNLGYVQVEKVKDTDGTFAGVRYTVYETAMVQNLDNGGGIHGVKSPPVDKTTRGKSDPHKKTNSFKKTKDLKKTITPNEFGAEFASFWETYPRKIGKATAGKKFAAALEVVEVDDLLVAVKHFAEHCERAETEKRYIPYPGTWLGQERWRDYMTAPVSKPSFLDAFADIDWDSADEEVRPF